MHITPTNQTMARLGWRPRAYVNVWANLAAQKPIVKNMCHLILAGCMRLVQLRINPIGILSKSFWHILFHLRWSSFIFFFSYGFSNFWCLPSKLCTPVSWNGNSILSSGGRLPSFHLVKPIVKLVTTHLIRSKDEQIMEVLRAYLSIKRPESRRTILIFF